jgi:hypothetical protein
MKPHLKTWLGQLHRNDLKPLETVSACFIIWNLAADPCARALIRQGAGKRRFRRKTAVSPERRYSPEKNGGFAPSHSKVATLTLRHS